MVDAAVQTPDAQPGGEGPGQRLSPVPQTDLQVLMLRWLALLAVPILDFFDPSQAGVLFPVLPMVMVIAAANVLVLLLRHSVRWLRQPLNVLALDTVLATLSVYLTGGYHSSFFVLYIFIAIGAAFYLELVPTVVVTLGIGLIYVGACVVNPAGVVTRYTRYMLAAKLLLLLVVAVMCALLLEQLRQEHRRTRRERALAQRLKALNDLFHELSVTLDLDQTLQTVAEAPRALLGADMAGIALLDDDGDHLSVVAAAGVDPALLAGQRWSIDDVGVATILSEPQPYVHDRPAEHLNVLEGALSQHSPLDAVVSIVSIPLRLDGRPLGLLGIGASRPLAFSEEEQVFLQALGQEAALAIRNARLYEREREQVAQLQALDELQDGFVSGVSHELRTPLTCIKTSVDLLQSTSQGLTGTQVELIETVQHHLGRLEAFVAELVEMTRLEAGRVTLSLQPTDLAWLAAGVAEALRPLSGRRQQTFRLEFPETLSLVAVDRRRIEQVLTNLLSNAIKFTPRKAVITLGVCETADQVEVWVADSGPGIPERDRERIFEKFYGAPDGRGQSGLGLGLYLARELVQLHGGRIWVDGGGRGQTGSTFRFALPKLPEEDGT